jgi:hypothetical protein
MIHENSIVTSSDFVCFVRTVPNLLLLAVVDLFAMCRLLYFEMIFEKPTLRLDRRSSCKPGNIDGRLTTPTWPCLPIKRFCARRHGRFVNQTSRCITPS